ncbi:hypothetical protein PSTA9_02387 [Pseudomonas syringae pv. tomato]|uniref:Uncharacterized protein n=1 Tax=Pseudomonas savastanoi TaxID=29438 RepID=A0A3M5BMH7_PSESS|nr:hypothetical protein PSTA9_02387 [Pseudomonas syringae pv. tomato]RMS26461.1 hypothetical protein ALP70_200192 [Pseudomonas savastanoi]
MMMAANGAATKPLSSIMFQTPLLMIQPTSVR